MIEKRELFLNHNSTATIDSNGLRVRDTLTISAGFLQPASNSGNAIAASQSHPQTRLAWAR